MKPAPDAPLCFHTLIHRLEKLKLNYLEIPAAVVQQLGGTFNIRLQCSVNGAEAFACGLVALGEGRGYITLSSKRMKPQGLQLGQQVAVRLWADTSEFGMEVPEELAELLRQDEEGDRRFRLLPPGKQRYIIYHVSGVKSSQKRLDRALLLINNLKQLPPGKEDFRAMLGLPPREAL
ncbi:YdeI/OmpD-associated family protein [Cesiribacter andamanensis]|nr:YdeI/OmpD-associated family protein [Cesiribacter andamanensis]